MEKQAASNGLDGDSNSSWGTMKKLKDMTALEIANYELGFYPTSKKAIGVRKTGTLECEIICDDGTSFKASGLIAHELGKALDREDEKTI